MALNFTYKTKANKDHEYFSESHLQTMHTKFKAIVSDEKNGFYNLTNEDSHLDLVDELVLKYQHKKHFVQIGIGGSALGPQMLLEALGDFKNHSFTLLNNIDSDFILRELSKIDITKAVFYVVSKSGGTAETIAITSIVRKLLLESHIAASELRGFFVFCTDPKNGQLREYVEQNNLISLEVPSNVGGRYSVLTSVGMFPAAFFNIDIRKIYAGAQTIKKNLENPDLANNQLLQTAAHIANRHVEANVNNTVLMPYSSLLKDFSFWFVQLWAESLGKISSTGKAVGLTPIPAYGATDQHSQMQLFMEGPSDKLMFLLNIKDREYDFSLDGGLNLSSAKKLEKYTLNQLMQAEFQGSVKALEESDKDVIIIELDRLNETTIGELILFFESLTALMGEHLEVDPFNQPGVEKGKIYAFEYLSNLK